QPHPARRRAGGRRDPLAPLSWLRVGGPAEVLFSPADIDDLAAFLAALPADVPVTPLGLASNLILRDGGLAGVAIRLGRAFAGVERLGGDRLRLGAALPDARAAEAAADHGLAGLEFLRTIPGALGGAARMNAGCYGAYLADVFVEAEAVARDGARVALGPGDMGFAYRATTLPADLVLASVTLQGRPDAPEAIRARMADQIARRDASQPTKARTCGSTFANPAGWSSTGAADDPMDLKAWRLIEQAGCRGLTRGGARISDKHANFLVNAGGATAEDLESLGEEVRERVYETSGIRLEWEIRRLGLRPAPPAPRKGDEQ
ncbi:MAG: UDP-N-acetylmuramate dehydrogenase, partial [Pseudomonadota bacterium]